MLEYFFAYIAGLLTLINPCILPILPIVLASALTSSRRGIIALATGLALSFVVFGMLVASIGPAIGLTQDRLVQISALFMVVFGVIMLIPALSRSFEKAMSGLSSKMSQISPQSEGVLGQFLGGMLLGAVWSPCIGPTLGGAIALASQGESLFHAFLIMCFFALGVASLILFLGLGAQSAIRGKTARLATIAKYSKPVLGITFTLVGLALLFELHHNIEGWLVQNTPIWLQDLSVKY